MNEQEKKNGTALISPSDNGIQAPFNPLERWDNNQARLQAMRNGLRNVLDSYQGTFDFLIEPVQNAVDEVEYRFVLHELALVENESASVINAPYDPITSDEPQQGY